MKENNTNKKNENDRINMVLSVIDKIYHFFEYKTLLDKQPDQLKLPKIGKSKQRGFNKILSTIAKAKSNGLKTILDGREITLDNASCLLKGIASKKINGSVFKIEYNKIIMRWTQY